MIRVYGKTQHYANLRVFRVGPPAAEFDGRDNVLFVRFWLGRMASHPESESGYSRYSLSTSAKALNPSFLQERKGWGQMILACGRLKLDFLHRFLALSTRGITPLRRDRICNCLPPPDRLASKATLSDSMLP